MSARLAVIVLFVLTACRAKKLDRAEVDKVVNNADRCTKDNDLACVVQVQVHLEKFFQDVRELDKDDKAYLDAAVKHIADEVELVKNTPPGAR